MNEKRKKSVKRKQVIPAEIVVREHRHLKEKLHVVKPGPLVQVSFEACTRRITMHTPLHDGAIPRGARGWSSGIHG
jgi:hypothetical protein